MVCLRITRLFHRHLTPWCGCALDAGLLALDIDIMWCTCTHVLSCMPRVGHPSGRNWRAVVAQRADEVDASTCRYGAFAAGMVLSLASVAPIVIICRLPECARRQLSGTD